MVCSLNSRLLMTIGLLALSASVFSQENSLRTARSHFEAPPKKIKQLTAEEIAKMFEHPKDWTQLLVNLKKIMDEDLLLQK
jgi:hypothetical protein